MDDFKNAFGVTESEVDSVFLDLFNRLNEEFDDSMITLREKGDKKVIEIRARKSRVWGLVEVQPESFANPRVIEYIITCISERISDYCVK